MGRQTVHIKPRSVRSTGRVHLLARGYTGPSTAQPDQASQCRISASEPVKALCHGHRSHPYCGCRRLRTFYGRHICVLLDRDALACRRCWSHEGFKPALSQGYLSPTRATDRGGLSPAVTGGGKAEKNTGRLNTNSFILPPSLVLKSPKVQRGAYCGPNLPRLMLDVMRLRLGGSYCELSGWRIQCKRLIASWFG